MFRGTIERRIWHRCNFRAFSGLLQFQISFWLGPGSGLYFWIRARFVPDSGLYFGFGLNLVALFTTLIGSNV